MTDMAMAGHLTHMSLTHGDGPFC